MQLNVQQTNKLASWYTDSFTPTPTHPSLVFPPVAAPLFRPLKWENEQTCGGISVYTRVCVGNAPLFWSQDPICPNSVRYHNSFRYKRCHNDCIFQNAISLNLTRVFLPVLVSLCRQPPPLSFTGVERGGGIFPLAQALWSAAGKSITEKRACGEPSLKPFFGK